MFAKTMQSTRTLDPRTKLALIIPANILLFTHASWQKECLIICYFVIIFIYLGDIKRALYYIGYFFLGIGIQFFVLPLFTTTGFWFTVVVFFAVTTRKLLPAMMAGKIFFGSTSSSEMLVALKKMHLPQTLTIPIAVVMRFFPTIHQEWRAIRHAMQMRGIGINGVEVLLHPLQMFEYVLVPFLMSAVKTSEELSVASLTRGIGNPDMHTTLQQIEIKPIDWLFIAITLGLTIYLFV